MIRRSLGAILALLLACAVTLPVAAQQGKPATRATTRAKGRLKPHAATGASAGAQHPGSPTGSGAVASGGTASQPQRSMLCVTGCGGGGGGGGITVTPDNSPTTVNASSSGNTRVFTITNNDTVGHELFAGCTATGGLTCTNVVVDAGPASDFILDASSSTNATVTFSAGGPGSGILKLKSGGEPTPTADSGWYSVTIAGAQVAPTIALERFNRAGIDRSVCFTTGAGPGASSCGDLTVTHAMPGFRTMGKDRALTLLYNSAASNGLTLIGAKVTQPATAATPTKITAILTVNGVKDSVDYNGTGPSSVSQIVLGRNLSSIATGYYPFTLRVRNVYAGGAYESVINDTVVVVNHSGSEYGRGWLLTGVERLYLSQPGGGILWVPGDGSGLIYKKLTAKTWVAPAIAFRDTIAYDSTTQQYTRTLRHGLKVVYDVTGRQIQVVNRQLWTTNFLWSTVGGQTRLTEIDVPGNDGLTRAYHLYYNATNAMLDSIRDPVNRAVTIARNGTQDSIFTDPDGRATDFYYNGGNMQMRGMTVPNPAATLQRSWTYFYYMWGTRFTGVSVQRDSAAGNFWGTNLYPWDQNGIGIGGTLNIAATYPSGGFASTVDGPISGTGDLLSAWVNAWGAPTKTVLSFTGATTTIAYGDANNPGLPTRIQYPLGRIVNLLYNGRGNLVRQVDTTAGLPVAKDSIVYGDTATPDGPTTVIDPLGRQTQYAYDAYGMTSTSTAPNGHVTAFVYTINHEVSSVTEQAVPVAIDSLLADTTKDLVTQFVYDGQGNLNLTADAAGVITSQHADSIGRPVAFWDAASTKSTISYDAMNRVTRQVTYTHRQSSPYSWPTGSGHHPIPAPVCDSIAFVCGDTADSWRTPMPDSLVVSTFHGLAGVDSVLDPRGVHHGYRYNAAGLVVQDLDEAHQPRISYYGANATLDSVRTRDSLTIKYGYDGMGRRTWMSWPAHTYPARGQGGWVPGATIPKDSILYTYDIEGHLLSSRSVTEHDTTTRTYFANGLLKSRRSHTTWALDSLVYGYNAAGQRTAMMHSTASGGQTARDSTTYRYGLAGNLDTMIIAMSAPTSLSHTISFEWDVLGRRKAVHYPNGRVVQMTYDARGTMRRLSALYEDCLGTHDNFCVNLFNTVDGAGRILWTDKNCGQDHNPGYSCADYENHNTDTTHYYQVGWVASQVSNDFPDSLNYDASGNITRRHPRWDTSHQYIMLNAHSNRLYQDTLEHVPPAVGGKKTYGYDGSGNRVLDTVPTTNWQIVQDRFWYYDALDRTRGLANYREIWPGAWGYFSDTTACRYDAEGKMIRVCDANSTVTYDGDNVVGTDVGIWHFFNGPGIDDPIIAYGQNDNANLPPKELYFVTDGGGRQYAISEPLGGFDSSLVLESGWWGWKMAGGNKNSTGFQPDRSSNPSFPGLSFFRNRIYDQQAGRWTQEDPMGVAGGINLYQYSGNNPASFTDPFGLCPPDTDGKPCTWRNLFRLQTSFGAQAGLRVETGIIGVGGRIQLGRVFSSDMPTFSDGPATHSMSDRELSVTLTTSVAGNQGGFKLDFLSDQPVLVGEAAALELPGSSRESTQRNGFNQEIKISASLLGGASLYLNMAALSEIGKNRTQPTADLEGAYACAKTGFGCTK